MSFKLARPAPSTSRVTDPFGPRVNPVTGKKGTHRGIDFGGKFKARVSIGGFVSEIGYNGSKTNGFGHYVKIRFNDRSSGKKVMYRLVYAHGSAKTGLVNGQSVSVGDVIFTTGHTGAATGDHLHFQLEKRIAGIWKAIDPAPYL